MGCATLSHKSLVSVLPSIPNAVDPAFVALLWGPWSGCFVFLWGLLWGSFANVVIWRLPQGQSVVRPRSKCPHCQTPLSWKDNIPVFSYLWLRGQCRHCHAKISLRYLVVEVLAGFLSFTLYMEYVIRSLAEGGEPGLWAWGLWFGFCLCLLMITYTDLDWWVIPNKIVLPLAGVGFVAALIAPQVLGIPAYEAVLAAGLGYGLIAGLRFIYQRLRGLEALGLGDAKLLLAIGAFCGLRGLCWTVAAGAIQGLIFSVPLLLSGRSVAKRKLEDVHGGDSELGKEDPKAGVMGMRVPFGPFLALAALEYVCLRTMIEDLFLWFTY